jgi:hypothetical protein
MWKCPTWLLESWAPTYKGYNFLYLGLFNGVELCVEFSFEELHYLPAMHVVSWLNIITKSSSGFWKCDRNSGCNFLYNALEIFGRLFYRYLFTWTFGSWWWSQWQKSCQLVTAAVFIMKVSKILWHYVNDPCKIIITIILVSMFSSCWSWHKKCTVIVLFLELPLAEWHSYDVWSCSNINYITKYIIKNVITSKI